MKQQPLLHTLSHSSRIKKSALLVVLDIFVASVGCYLSFALRYMDGLIETRTDVLISAFVIAPPLMVISLWVRGVYNFSLRSMGQRDIWIVVQSVGVAVFAWGTVVLLLRLSVPRSVILIYGFVSLLGILGGRFLITSLLAKYDPIHGSIAKSRNAIRVVIYGAGVAGRQLLDDLNRGNEYRPIAFVDDNPDIQGTSIGGTKVYAPSTLTKIIDFQQVQYILVAIPSLSMPHRKRILEHLKQYNVNIKVLPSVADIIGGKATVSAVREVDVIDLLGREEIAPVGDLLHRDIAQKSVFVSGAGGSIGSVLCEKILSQRPKKLVLLDSSEYALYTVERTLKKVYPNAHIIPVLGSVCDENTVNTLLQTHTVHTLYHAAAYKHVPIIQNNPFVGLHNNIMGTHTLVKSAVQHKVKNFVLVSTDKAVRPTNIMGATKRMAEIIVQSYAKKAQTQFSIVRFGNVLDSSGSVIPLFREQIQNGGPVTVTHQQVTRFFMTIPEAANLIIQAGAMGKNGDVFVLDMGDSVKITNLAEKMITLAGFRPYTDIDIVYTGLRTGEKMYEELVLGNNIQPTAHPRISQAHESFIPYTQLLSVLDKIDTCIVKKDTDLMHSIFTQYVDGYTYNNSPTKQGKPDDFS